MKTTNRAQIEHKKSAKRAQKSAKVRKRAQKSAKERKRPLFIIQLKYESEIDLNKSTAE